ncbi:MAG: hypothetical protein J0H74_36730 [Chitinophagaceae bacterium]|nr:hypothetical protein [Chitinophagaceae bacterium]
MIFIIQRIINSLTRQRYQRPYRHTGRYVPLHHTVRQPRESGYTVKFYDDLLKTVGWTESIIIAIKDIDNIDHSRVLRTTNPLYEGKSFYTFDEASIAMPPNIPFNYEDVLSEAMSTRPASTLSLEDICDLGKILRFQIDITTLDGAPCAENGFVDSSDIPPIDTWFCIARPYLYCWIPRLFIDKMQDVIDVEILGSYEWIELGNMSRPQ